MYVARPAGTTHSCLHAKLFLRTDLASDVGNLTCECSHVAHCNGLFTWTTFAQDRSRHPLYWRVFCT
jgi:hypothetical protein